MLQRELPLDSDALMDRLVMKRLGGYCYEHNALLFEVFRHLGYAIECRLARVILPHTDYSLDTPLTHRFNILTLDDNRYLVEGGFSHMTPARLLPLFGNTNTSITPYRVRHLHNGHCLYELYKDQKWIPLYRFEDRIYPEPDLLMGHFWSHRHPDAPFVNHLVASRVTDEEVLSLRNRTLWRITPHTTTEHDINTANKLHTLLQKEFGLNINPSDCNTLFKRVS
jgi:N-hydroxyarylamine O-acetyltransferase